MSDYTLYLGDCLEYMRTMEPGSIDAVITDPPYPDYYTDLYNQNDINFLSSLNCIQLIFWSAKVEFQLSYTAVHIWNKMIGTGSQYERIIERNGKGGNWKVYSINSINNVVRADMAQDKLYGHPSQKPRKLISQLLLDFTNPGDLIFDPFMGSGTTGVACMQLGRRFIGCEIDPNYYAIAERRIKQAAAQMLLPLEVRT